MNTAVQDPELSVKLRFRWRWKQEVSRLLSLSLWNPYSTMESSGLCRAVAHNSYHLPLTLSPSSGQPSWSVSGLQPPEVPGVWVACAFCPSCHPSLAEPPAQLLPWLWFLNWSWHVGLYKHSKQSEKELEKGSQIISHAAVQVKWEKRHMDSPSHSIFPLLLTLTNFLCN